MSGVPPDDTLYQSTVSPASTVAVMVGTTPEAQYDLSPPLTGGRTTGQEQFGAVIARELWHPPLSVTVTVTFTPAKTPVIVQTFAPVLVAIPEVHVTVPVLTVTASEYVAKSVEQVAGVVIKINGEGLTKLNIPAEVAEHPPAFVTTTSTILPLVSVLVCLLYTSDAADEEDSVDL